MQMSTIENGNDVVTFLKSQHAQVKQLFGDVLAADGEKREKLFVQLRRMLAVHETAEEEIVHPAARRALANGEQIIKQRLQEENEAKKMLTELESLDVRSPGFVAKLRALQAAVIAHAESEEREEFNKLGSRFDAAHLKRMKRAAEIAESIAPTRPHPGVESQWATMITGPFASMMDRARDALSGKAS